MNRVKDVLTCFNGDKAIKLSKQEIIKNAGLYYYHNTDKHAGDVLSRMVKSGLLIRVSKGWYMLGNGIKKKEVLENINQVKINLESN